MVKKRSKNGASYRYFTKSDGPDWISPRSSRARGGWRFFRYLTKPVDELTEVLETLLTRDQPASAG